MSKIRDIVLVGAASIFLCATLGLKALYRLDVPLPGFLETDAERSVLEGKTYQKHPEFSLEALRSGVFGSELESYLADAVPCRDQALLLNARIQRLAIAAAAGMFGFEAYPTFYGSDYAYIPTEQVVCRIAPHASGQRYTSLAQSLGAVVAAHPKQSFYLYVVSRPTTTYHEPSADLVTDPETAAYVAGLLRQAAGERLNVIDSSPASFANYSEAFFDTDHHWTMDGAYQAYRSIAAAMNPESASLEPNDRIVFDAPAFYGSQARAGLIVDNADRIVDYSFDLPSYSVEVDGKPADPAHLNHRAVYEAGAWAADSPYQNRYGEYFHGDHAEIVLRRDGEERSGKSLLIITNSYSNCMERLFLSDYDTVYVVDPRYSKATCSSYLAEHPEIDDVLVLACPTTLASANSAAFFA